jgi:dethiobiotin synthetase/adenosylmethionine--8-amino-7-oxononanoate aminotransferase
MQVLALKGSYHGDTLGAMDAQAPSAYTGFLQQPWYVQGVSESSKENVGK